jgi:DNA-binding beta-propeller fold protein YncE
VSSDGTRLFVADSCNNRVLIWNSIPRSPSQKADVVVGQPSMTASGANYGGSSMAPSAQGLNSPLAAVSDGQRLYVADTGNNRVLIYDPIPTQSGAAASLVLGQPDAVSAARQNLDRTSLYAPAGMLSDGTRLFVADSGADRVLIWNMPPTRTQAPADVVIGQTDFKIDQRLRPASLRSLDGPYGVHVYQGRLFVVDRGNNRVLYFNQIPTQNGQSADGWIGQPSAADITANNSGDIAHPQVTGQTLSAPTSLLATADMLYIADAGNNRVVVVPNPPPN